MTQRNNHPRKPWINRLARNNALLLVIVWTLLLGLFLQWNLTQARLQDEHARLQQCEAGQPWGSQSSAESAEAAPFSGLGTPWNLSLAYTTVWLAGLLVIGFFGSQIKNNYAEIEHYQLELEHLATHDPLTDFFNRNQMTALLEVEIARARRYRHNLGLLLLDIDHFKHINDQYGHQSGDIVLVTLAETLKKSVRTIDYVARYGGEEFLIIMPETSVEMALVSAERIRATVEESPVLLPDGKELHLTCSIGVSAYPTSGKDMDELLNAADKALYSAKNLGRNRVVYCR